MEAHPPCGPSSSRWPDSPSAEPIIKLPAGTTTIWGQSGQSRKTFPAGNSALSEAVEADRHRSCLLACRGGVEQPTTMQLGRSSNTRDFETEGAMRNSPRQVREMIRPVSRLADSASCTIPLERCRFAGILDTRTEHTRGHSALSVGRCARSFSMGQDPQLT
jgi:hypothetical protein